jgi:probable rRNA maturation factor
LKEGAITLVVEEAAWRSHRGLLPKLKAAAIAARRAGRLPAKRRLTILLAGDKRLKALNHDFRGKTKPTNVLSFPSDESDYAGDVALAYGVTRKEALAAGKSFADHASHLVVHGVLHLAGYDHITAHDARAMEPLETKILAKLGISNPYEVRA